MCSVFHIHQPLTQKHINMVFCLVRVRSIISMTLEGLHWWLRHLRICLQCRRPRFDSWVGKILWRRDRLRTSVFLAFPCGSAGEESAGNAGDLGLIPVLGRSPGEGKDYSLLYPGQENSMDCIVHGVSKSWIWLKSVHPAWNCPLRSRPICLFGMSTECLKVISGSII